MFAIERLNKIKEILFREKRIDVYELSEKFSVTEVTIRRDLDKLEQMGLLVKFYGGAMLNEEYAARSGTAAAVDAVCEEKRQIGKIAAQMVESGDAIFLGPGSTCMEIARNLQDKRVTVVTNDAAIGIELKNSAGIKVMITGGDLLPATSTLVGGFALRALQGIYINKAFIGVRGVNMDSGYTLDSHEEVSVIQSVLEISSEVIIVADYTKFNRTGFARLGGLDLAKQVITNKQLPAAYKTYYFEQAVKLYTTFTLK